MGIKDLWSVLTPYAERKPISELRGKTVAIDLAGWVCDSLNVVDYFVHPRQHLKNLFFRTCYLIWEDVTPVFVLEGVAPKLKCQVMAQRNEVQFRGTKPRNKEKNLVQTQSQSQADKGRSRFNHVLKQCESLLQSMGIQCVQGPGEAEAYCAFLNKNEIVDGVISQDSDCFAYGAVRVYRNFSVSTQGALAAQGGAVDIYDMRKISQKMDLGQNKIIAMALLCGCDYCPEGIGGVGREGVLKLFKRYTDKDVLDRLRSWRQENSKYTALEMRVYDKTICSNCGHIGRTQSHTKSGCGACRTNRGCNELLWKEERLALKAELALRKKALANSTFPNEEIIREYLLEPDVLPHLNLSWKQPNMMKFIRQIGNLLQWPEIYCFQKFLPIVTRWQVRNAQSQQIPTLAYVQVKEVVKKRTQKGIPSLEVIWQDERGLFDGLIPVEQLKAFEEENAKGLQELWTTVEPYHLMENVYPAMVAAFIKSKEKPKKLKKPKQKIIKTRIDMPLGSLENLDSIKEATNEIANALRTKRYRKGSAPKKGLQLIDKFFKQKLQTSLEQLTPKKYTKSKQAVQCSTPITLLPSDLDSDNDNLDMSDIINGFITRPVEPLIKSHAGHRLYYEPVPDNLSLLLRNQSVDDLDVLVQKRNCSISQLQERESKSRRVSLDDSFDILVKKQNHKLLKLFDQIDLNPAPEAQVNHCKRTHNLATPHITSDVIHEEQHNVSHFFTRCSNEAAGDNDAFKQLMEQSFSTKSMAKTSEEELILISDSSVDGELS